MRVQVSPGVPVQICSSDGTGRRTGLKIPGPKGRVGSSPTLSTSNVRKGSVYMSKRPLYVILLTQDYDGTETNVAYVGTNMQAAVERYKFIFQQVKEQAFLNRGYPEEDLSISFDNRVNTKSLIKPGFNSWSYINDNCEVYWTIQFMCILPHRFVNGADEERYKQEHPNAKY